ncbi:MAG TPA: NAD(P)H-dependent oxidoreductase [Candidatus Acidoferrum sp.]|nr:NAD(P)H-dependent oxidoreductase [Candidatus Acidoferrum sp.]
MTTKELLSALEWRYATKRFDPKKKISDDVWQALERALVLTPTSYGLQPYRFIVLTNPEKRAELLAHSWKQHQVVDCSHYVVLTARTKITEVDIDNWIRRLSEIRKMPVEMLASYRGMMVGDVVHGSRAKASHEWAIRQAYIALGNLMTCAAVLGVDACPMEGIVSHEYDNVLGLHNSGYATCVACALGHRSETDKNATLPKARFDAAELIRKI